MKSDEEDVDMADNNQAVQEDYDHLLNPSYNWVIGERDTLHATLLEILPGADFFQLEKFMDILYPKVIRIFGEHFPDNAGHMIEDLWNVFLMAYAGGSIVRLDRMNDFLRDAGIYEGFRYRIWEHWKHLLRQRLVVCLGGNAPLELSTLVMGHIDNRLEK